MELPSGMFATRHAQAHQKMLYRALQVGRPPIVLERFYGQRLDVMPVCRSQLARLSCGWGGTIGAVNAGPSAVATGCPTPLLRHRVEIPWLLRSSRKGKAP